MMVGGSRQITVVFATHQGGVPVILRDLLPPDGFSLVSPSFMVGNVYTDLYGLRLTCYRTEMYLQSVGHWLVVFSAINIRPMVS